MDVAIAAEIGNMWRTYGGGRILQADHATIGILSPEEIEKYGLDLEAYETLDFKQQDKFASFFTAVQRTNKIILEYAAQGLLPLTLRQIHYQHVVRYKDYPNTKISYDHLAVDLVVGRMTGFIPWNAIDDPTRNLHEFMDYDSVEDSLMWAARSHHLNRWRNQDFAPVCLVEKDAALSVIARACDLFFVPYASLKGYGSVAALRNKIANYCLRAIDRGQTPVIIHLSDSDASGWDMPRNLLEYLNLMVRQQVDVRHIALTLDQIAEGYGDGNPLPPDPVKATDPRAGKYIAMLAERGLEPGAWEMDALPPAVLHDVVVSEIESLRDKDRWQKIEDQENEQKATITKMADAYEEPDRESIETSLQAVKQLLDESQAA